MVYGPIAHHISSLSAVNTSNQRIRDIIQGKNKSALPPTGVFFWTDVRDLALAHVRAAEVPEAGGNRFFITAGYYSNREIADAIKEAYPDLADQIPGDDVKSDLDLNSEFGILTCMMQFLFFYMNSGLRLQEEGLLIGLD